MITRWHLTGLFLLILAFFPSSWAAEASNREISARVGEAVKLRKQNEFNSALRILYDLRSVSSKNILVRVELAATLFRAGYFGEGSVIFRKLLADRSTPENIRKNISFYINKNKKSIRRRDEVDRDLSYIKDANEPIAEKIRKLSLLAELNTNYFPARIYLIALCIRGHKAECAKHYISTTKISRLSPRDELRLKEMKERYARNFDPQKRFSGSLSITIGSDSNITGGSDSEYLLDNLDQGFDEEGFDEEDFEEEGFDEEGFDEEGFEEEGFDEEDFEEEGFEEEDFDEGDFDEGDVDAEETSGLFTRINGNVQYRYSKPIVSEGNHLYTYENGVSVSYYERQHFDDIASNRNYQVVQLGGFLGKRNVDKSNWLLPLSVKMVRLDGRDYAIYYDGGISYSWNGFGSKWRVSEDISYRDYSDSDSNRGESLLFETDLGVSRPLSDSLTLGSMVGYGVLNTPDEDFRSYRRFIVSSSLTYRATRHLKIVTGFSYQATRYDGENFLFYDFSREDDYLNLYIESDYRLSNMWSLTARLSKSNRSSNQNRYEYDRNTFSLGLKVSF